MSNIIDNEARQEELLDDLYDTISCIVLKYKNMMGKMAKGNYTPKNALDDAQEMRLNEGADLMHILEELGNYA